MTLERLCAQGVPGWGPMLKTTAASVGLTAPSQVASSIPRAYTPITVNSSRGKTGLCEHILFLPPFLVLS